VNFKKLTAVAMSAALVGVATLAFAVPASAVTTLGSTTFYGSSDFGVEAGGYPAGVDWFFGDVNDADGSRAFTGEGLSINGAATGEVQILNQNFGTTFASADEVEAYLSETYVVASNSSWVFQLPLFAEGNAGFTTLRPDTAGVITSATTWITSGDIPGSAYLAGDDGSLSDLLDAVYAGTAPTILAYGLFFRPVDVTSVVGIETPTGSSVFLPQPVRTLSPSPISATDFATAGKGLTLTGTGWLPNSPVYLSIGSDETGEIYKDLTYTTDAEGNISITVVLDAVPALGTYTIYFDDDDELWSLGALPSLELEVVAAAAAAPVLAATGSDGAGLIAATGSLLLLGGLVTLVALRRKTASA